MPGELPVSVIIPGYNAAEYLGEALDSVAAQTSRPCEVIVVDDGSRDDTRALAERWGARVIAQRNSGVAGARNTGVRASRGAWLAFLDADDVWEPGRLATQCALGALLPAVRLIASDYRLFGAGQPLGEAVLAGLARFRGLRREPVPGGSCVPRAELLRALLEGNFVLPSSWLVDRRAFEEDGVWFCARDAMPSGGDFHIGEDYEWLLRMLRHTDVAFADAPLVAYRRSNESLSASGGRLRYGDAKLGDMVRAAPDRYAAGAAAAFAELRPRQVREAALRFIVAGDIERARRILREALAARPDLRTRALFAATAPFATPRGAVAFGRLHRIWREHVRPAVLALRKIA